MIHEQAPVQVIHFVLHSTRQQSFPLDLDLFTLQIGPGDGGSQATTDGGTHAGDTQASFNGLLGLFGDLDQLGIDQDVKRSIDIEDDDSLGYSDLWRRKADAVAANHLLDHPLADAADLVVDDLHQRGGTPQRRVSVGTDGHGFLLLVVRPHYKVVDDMSQGNSACRDTIHKVLRLEASKGYRDTAVSGGLEAFVQRHLPSAAPIVEGYGAAAHFDRQRTLARLHEHLEDTASGTSSSAESAQEETASGDSSDASSAQTVKPDPLAPIEAAKGVGAKRAALLAKLGIVTMEDLLLYLPRRLEDRSRFSPIGQLAPGCETAVRGTIAAINQVRVRRGMTVVKAAIGDGTGFVYAVWFNQPWLMQQLRRGEAIDLYGRVERNFQELQLKSPVWEPAEAGINIGRIVPVYPATEGISERSLRALIARHLDTYLPAFPEILSAPLRRTFSLLAKQQAIRGIHFPEDEAAFQAARTTLAFEELFLLQLGLLSTARSEAGAIHALDAAGDLVNSFVASLPFAPTAAQRAALREIEADLAAPERMMRLLQGDVGSGKTLVAVVAALRAIEAGFQVAFMAPTELLAEQHGTNIRNLLDELPVRMAVLTGATKDKQSVNQEIASGQIDLVVGTHALIQESVEFGALGLVIIDEQHRFGVVQRSQIEDKGDRVDLLVMSATPIPRTIALTLYGEFDVSTLDELPMGEKKIATHWISESRRDEVYDRVAALLSEGSKGYVVLPLVEESEKVDANAAVQVAEELTARFPDNGVGLIHGRLAPADKATIMEQFRDGGLQILVSTTVIEVGIDVLDANFMVIEHADRFGLSQLHQLRGRIGRAGQKATCFAIAGAKTDEARARLAAFAEHNDGFALAEVDFAIRGPGDLLGTQQHGFLSQLRAVDFSSDLSLMQRAHTAARRVQAEGIAPELMEEIERRFGETLRWLRV